MFKKQDFSWGEIKRDGQKICEITANYVGFCDFDGARYWDYREQDLVHYPIQGALDYIGSDARNRTDGQFLLTKTTEEAQAEKVRLEEIQRNDRKLREATAKRRASGGPKHVLPTAAANSD